jgi:muramoyltetrapeptide carboxypeptidase
MTVLDRIRLTGPSAPFRLPPALAPGATIGIAALSGRVDAAKLDAGIARLASLGFRVREAANLRLGHGDFAGDDRARAEGYRSLVADPEVDAIFFARGGWGAARVLHLLDAGEIAARPKIHMGGSDLTTLFAYLHAHARLACFHGPMVAVDFALSDPDPRTEESWQAVLSGVPQEIPLAPEQILRPGSASAPVVGGCLSMLVSLEGTPEALATQGRVVFWEDVHEEIYRLDRMLTQWKRAGRFDGVAGVIIGALENIRHNGKDDAEALSALLFDHFGEAPFPVVRDWPAGHGRLNRTLALGGEVAIDTARGVARMARAVA